MKNSALAGDRRQFLKSSTLGLSVFTIGSMVTSRVVIAQQTGGQLNLIVGKISNNHGHAASLETEDLANETGFRLNIRGESNHPHTIDLTTDILEDIARGNVTDITSSRDGGHSHIVRFERVGALNQIGNNHGHDLFLPVDMLRDDATATPIQVNIRGTSSHPHTVTISAADQAKLLAGEVVRVASSNDAGHAHAVAMQVEV